MFEQGSSLYLTHVCPSLPLSLPSHPPPPPEEGWFEIEDSKNHNIYVSGLPRDVTPDEFEQLMSKYGIIMEDDDGGCGFLINKNIVGKQKMSAPTLWTVIIIIPPFSVYIILYVLMVPSLQCRQLFLKEGAVLGVVDFLTFLPCYQVVETCFLAFLFLCLL